MGTSYLVRFQDKDGTTTNIHSGTHDGYVESFGCEVLATTVLDFIKNKEPITVGSLGEALNGQKADFIYTVNEKGNIIYNSYVGRSRVDKNMLPEVLAYLDKRKNSITNTLNENKYPEWSNDYKKRLTEVESSIELVKKRIQSENQQ